MGLTESNGSAGPKRNGSSLPDPKSTKEAIRSINQPQSHEHNFSSLKESLGGTDGLLKLLCCDPFKGIPSSSVDERRSMYGPNSLPASPRQSFFQLFVDTFDDATVQILLVAAIVSLAVGIYEDPATGYVEGLAILVANLIVSVVTAVNDYQKETQFRELSDANDNVDVKIVRDGNTVQMTMEDVVVGDLIQVEAGDAIPCDGVLVRSDGLEVDESALTGEPIDVEKNSSLQNGDDPFVLSGCVAAAGSGTFVCIATGRESQWGKIKEHLEKEQDQTPLQEKLDRMAELIGYVGMAAAALTFIAMMIIKIVVKPEYLQDISVFGYALDAFIIGVTIVVVAVPEGLPLAVTISLAYSTKKMLADKNLIRHLAACETMGNATNICSDKTGTLTENRMTVVKGTFANVSFDDMTEQSGTTIMDSKVSNCAREIILQGIATCSTAKIQKDHEADTDDEEEDINGMPVIKDKRPHIIGNKTEGALLLLGQSDFFGNDNFELRREKAQFGAMGGSRLFPFSSTKKSMSVFVKQEIENDKPLTRLQTKQANNNQSWTLYHKGAAESVIKECSSYLDADGSVQTMTEEKREKFNEIIRHYASLALRCIALSHRDHINEILDPTTANIDTCKNKAEKGMVLDAVFGIIDPLRTDVVNAVQVCQKAGIMVRMVTGDNIDTARAIAKEAGILSPDGISMEGQDFRKLTPAQLDKILPSLQVLARSSPEDKHILVQRLNGGLMPKTEEEWCEAHPGMDFKSQKDLLLPGYYEEWAKFRNGVGEVVGVTGDGTNDGPALKAADVGLSMGISGTDVAKNASDIIIMDDNFSSIVKAVRWGRSVFDNIRKFLQFQLTVNVVALTITFLSAVAGYKPPLNAVMMLWVNLIMDTMGALALGTEPPTDQLLDRQPYRRDSGLISKPMWRNILVQASYQLGLLTFLLMNGPHMFGCKDGSTHHFTIIFNAFVFCQIFNEFNAREIGDVFDPFRNLSQSPMFLFIIFFTIVAQWIIVEFGGDFTQTHSLTFEEWKITAMLGSMSIPFGYIMRLIPVEEDPESFAGVEWKEKQTLKKKSQNSILGPLMIPILVAGFYKVYELNI